MNLNLSDKSKPDRSNTWKLDAIKKEISIFDLTDKYTHWLISKFTPIAKIARLTLEQLEKMIIGESMTAQEKEILTKILYNKEAILA